MGQAQSDNISVSSEEEEEIIEETSNNDAFNDDDEDDQEDGDDFDEEHDEDDDEDDGKQIAHIEIIATGQNESYFTFLNEDSFRVILQFLPRSDLVGIKLTCKDYYTLPFFENLFSPKLLYEEFRLYLKTIQDVQYSWQNSSHMRVTYARSQPADPNLQLYLLCTRYIVTHNLWWFSIATTYDDVFPGQYIFLFHTTVLRYHIEFALRRRNAPNDEQIKWAVEQNRSNAMETLLVTVPERGSLHIACQETNSCKHLEKVYYILLIPKVYWNHLQKVLPVLNKKY